MIFAAVDGADRFGDQFRDVLRGISNQSNKKRGSVPSQVGEVCIKATLRPEILGGKYLGLAFGRRGCIEARANPCSRRVQCAATNGRYRPLPYFAHSRGLLSQRDVMSAFALVGMMGLTEQWHQQAGRLDDFVRVVSRRSDTGPSRVDLATDNATRSHHRKPRSMLQVQCEDF